MKPTTLFYSLVAILALFLTAHPAQATNRTVTNFNDGGAGSLRDAVAASVDGDTINFSITGTINLTSAGLVIAHSITINGPGANVLNVSHSGSGYLRIFNIMSGTVSISGLTISDGFVQSTAGGFGGGGIRNNGTLTLNSCAIVANQAIGNGSLEAGAGGIWNDTGGTLTMLNCTVKDNAIGSTIGGSGGGILNNGALIMINSTVSGNNARGGNGVDDASVRGGGIANGGNGTLSMVNCTVSNNAATLYNTTGSPGTATGGGIYQASGTISLRNVIVAGNNVSTPNGGGTASDPDVFGAFNSQGYNLVGNTGDSSGWIASDKTNANAVPLNLGPLQSFGGPTQTMPLLVGSVAIDAGDDSVIGPPLNLVTDQRGSGFPRRIGAHVDIGAFEFSPIFVVTTVSDHDDGACDSDCTLREAINAVNANPGDDSITFAPGLIGTIQLGSALPNLSTNINLQGPGINAVTVGRNTGGNYRIFTVSNGTTNGPTVSVSGLTIFNGLAPGNFNLPDSGGGGIFGDYATLGVSNCNVIDNTARYGGGIFNFRGTLNINNSTLTRNIATTDGGGIFDDGVGGGNDTIVTNTTFNGNTANGGNGGGMENFGGAITLTNCTFSGNTAFHGGAINNDGNGIAVSLTLRSCTFSASSTAGSGSGNINNLAIFGGAATLTMSNNVFKTGAQGPNFVNSSGTVTSQGYNLSNDAAGGDGGTGPGGLLNATGDIRNTDPLLGAQLANNGGPTQTLALLSGSPAINHGDPTAPVQDQRYYLRSGTPDIGAFEFGGTLAPISAVSRKMHGSANFDINLPLNGVPRVECRTGGATGDYQIILTFTTPVVVTGIPQGQITSGTGQIGTGGTSNGGTVSINGTIVTVPLTNVANAQKVTLTLFGVSDGANTNNASVSIGFLLGDTSGNGIVNATDVSQTKVKSGQIVDSTNFRTDVTVSNSINSSDVSIVKAKSGTALPP